MEEQVTVEALATRFLEWVQKNRALNTFKLYSCRLRPFRAKYGSRAFEDLKPLDIDDYLHEVNHRLDGSEFAPDTIRQNVIALEQLQRFATSKLEIAKQIIRDLEKPVGRIRDRLATDEEFAKIVAAASPEFSLVYRALRQSGARPNELSRATVADWDRTQDLIILTKHKTGKKTGRNRIIPVGEKLKLLILESLGTRTAGPLFLAPHGKAWTTRKISDTFARVRAKVGIVGSLVAYAARHAFATEVTRKKDLATASVLCGHENMNTTKRYDHKPADELRSLQDLVDR